MAVHPTGTGENESPAKTQSLDKYIPRELLTSARFDKQKEAGAYREEARRIVEEIAAGLREIGLRESFLSQPQVRALMR